MARRKKPDQNLSLQDRIYDSLHFGRLHHFFMATIMIYAAVAAFIGTSFHTPFYEKLLSWADNLFLLIFIIEISLKIFARPKTFLKQYWNIADLAMLAVAFFSPEIKVLRTLRFLLYLHTFSTQNFVKRVMNTFHRSLPTLITSSAILTAVTFCYGLLSTHLFGKKFPDFFGHVGSSIYTLFQVMTLESWSEGVARPVMAVYPWAWVVFVSYILLTAYGITNIFIGAIVNAMSFIDTADEPSKNKVSLESLEKELKSIKKQLSTISKK